jgi:transcriptional regulator with XRE-family HTH domain
MRSHDRAYSNFIDEFASYFKHYKGATGASDLEIAKHAGLAQTTVSRLKRGAGSPNLRSFWRILHATGGDDLPAEGVLGIRLRAVNGRQRRSA